MARFGDLDTQYFDDAGDPLINGKVYFYETGTSTPKTTYADVNFSIPNTNPVILTAAGRQPNVFFRGVAKAVLATSAGVQILVRDPVGETDSTFGNPWVSSKSYNANDVVQGSNGVFYVSLINGNVNNDPVTTSGSWTFLYSVEWSAGTTYKEGSVVTYDSIVYQSLQNANINKNPATETAWWVPIQLVWNSTSTYAINSNVVGTDGVLYTSLQNANTGNIPASSPLWWIGTSAAAAASASAALASENAAALSETNAAASELAAATSETNAAASELAAAASESAAALSESNAAASEIAAAASQSAAAASASAASTSAGTATSKAAEAVISAAASASSASSAAAIVNLSSVLQFTSVKKLARAIYLTVASSGSNGIQILSSVQNNFTTGDFSVTWLGGLLDYTTGAAQILFSKYDGSLGYRGGISSTGYPYVIINASTYTATAIAPVVDGNVPRIDWAVTRETATVAGQVIFICNGVQLGSAVTIPVSGTSMSNTSNLYFMGTSTTRTAGLWLESMVRNSAITATDALAEITNGIKFASIGASQTPIYTSDFSVGTDSWAAASGTTIAGNIDAIGGKDNNLRATTDGTSSARFVRTFSAAQFQKNNKIVIEMYRPSANVTCTQVDVRVTVGTSSSGTVSLGDYALTADAWTTLSIAIPSTLVTNNATAISLYFADAAGATSNNTNGDILYLASGGTLTQVGINGHWNAEDAQNMTGQIIDISGNKNHALLPSVGATLFPSSRAGQVRGTNTWAATSETQYVTGINQAHMNAATAFQNIDIIASGAVTVNIGDGSDVDRFGASISLSTGRNRVTLLTPFVDGTNLKLTLTPTGAFTGTLETTATFTVLED